MRYALMFTFLFLAVFCSPFQKEESVKQERYDCVFDLNYHGLRKRYRLQKVARVEKECTNIEHMLNEILNDIDNHNKKRMETTAMVTADP